MLRGVGGVMLSVGDGVKLSIVVNDFCVDKGAELPSNVLDLFRNE